MNLFATILLAGSLSAALLLLARAQPPPPAPSPQPVSRKNPGFSQKQISVMPAILKQLHSPDAEEREGAVSTLQELGRYSKTSGTSDRVVTALLPVVRDVNAVVRGAATKAVCIRTSGDAPVPVVKAIAERLKDKNKDIRYTTQTYFFNKYAGNYSPVVQGLLELTQVPIRPVNKDNPFYSIQNPPEARGNSFAVRNWFEDSRRSAFGALGRIARKNEMVRNALLKRLSASSADSETVFKALVYTSIKRLEIVPQLLEQIQKIEVPQSGDEAEQAKQQFLRADKLLSLLKAQQCRPETFPLLTQAFDREQPAVRREMLFLLRQSQNWLGEEEGRFPPGDINDLVPAAPEPSLGFDWLGDSLLHDTDKGTRRSAVEAIQYAADPKTPNFRSRNIQFLLPLRNDPETEVRVSTARALVYLISSVSPQIIEKWTGVRRLSSLQDGETVISGLKGLSSPDQASMPDCQNLLSEATQAQVQLAEVIKRRDVAPSR